MYVESGDPFMDSPLFGFYLFAFNFGVLMICTINGITMINHTIGSATITPAYPIKGMNNLGLIEPSVRHG